ncbi:DUF2283 domain-containing protein [uncultured Thiodictyon sp.]|uniref:DUF2283 domain-containing protein n=1 Tax=uncultured Thiodictyon sp. TaxID=1846217 RepID=UPI0025D2A893|nr:DUF2283 domain-containing protein [uncultured Thiodictyon sp.]
MNLEFDPVADAAYLEISTAQIETTNEIEPGILADYDGAGRIVGVEILSVSRRSNRVCVTQAVRSGVDGESSFDGPEAP